MTYDYPQFTTLADPTRRAVFELVAERPRSVAEITRALTVTQSAVSQHLKVLREAQLVRAVPKGASNIYHIDPDGLERLRAELDRFWGKTLTAYKAAVENTPKEEPQ
ncbi:helix-turn-helix transcriptional regulator [Nitratireductor sp. ZSWI3]|uniref:ArsR/SmtB family transcription factor n=1 Tax=Nitratireductor sp. ZSWI3 TaxID=2966359 RepID=UPI0021505184|nr:metalloregulator ArsR/SmtB family transcription factor [Nitratireductor sp. ZSWI3]MCR4266380.1 metalloregulator ArsR/SmtB family transcription factor [Nitratireductor sp. ZSWI3]